MVLVVEVEGIDGVVGMVVMGAGLTVVSVDVVRLIMGEVHAVAESASTTAETPNAIRDAKERFFIDIFLGDGKPAYDPLNRPTRD